MPVLRHRVLPVQRRLSLIAAVAGCCVAGPLLQAPAQAQLMAAAGTEAGSAASTSTTLDAPRPHSQLALLNASDGSPAEGQPFRFAITPERRALLNTIRYAEGTWARGENLGYRIMFGGGLMPHLERHPDRVIYSGGYASAAAGAYQFMPFTWARASRSLQLPGFGPDVQDQAAIFLIQRRGALPLADQGAFTPELAARLAPEWASFPTLAGRSFYGQPVKRYGALKAFYERNLAELRAIAGMVPVVAELPSCEPADSLRCRLERLDRLGPRSVAQSR
jgi:muramidase (phage lysozyme)